MSELQFSTTLDPDLYVKGLARQQLDFHAAVGELLDNSFSARRTKFGNVTEPAFVEISLEHTSNHSVILQVADDGIGISLNDITTKVFNLGGQGTKIGSLNEHGFGLKNALALLTGGNVTQFSLITRSDVDNLATDTFLRVNGPLLTDMSVITDADREEWVEDLTYLKDAATGTKIRVEVSWQYFSSLYKKGGPGFSILVERLGEHIGVMHRKFLAANNVVKIAYRDTMGDWVHQDIQPISVPYLGDAKIFHGTVLVNGQTQPFVYSRGVLDYSVKDNEAKQEKGWPYPLKIYYQGSNARCGIDIVVRDRVIKTGVFEEIWVEIPKTVDFNRFTGELEVGETFRTTNNKTGLDPHAENWQQLITKLNDTDFTPEKSTHSHSEKLLREQLALTLRGTFSGATVTEERGVWGGSNSIDIFVDDGASNIRVYELKITNGRIVDLYQLIAGWDGLVKEGIQPMIGILVVKGYTQNLETALEAANQRKDNSDKPYVLEIKKIEELLPNP